MKRKSTPEAVEELYSAAVNLVDANLDDLEAWRIDVWQMLMQMRTLQKACKQFSRTREIPLERLRFERRRA